ncbi:MAG: DUF1003 domain-containing protein [Sphingomonadales bacterium]
MINASEAQRLVLDYLDKDITALEREERNVIKDLAGHSVTSRDAMHLADEQATYWDRLADRVAAVGGSWPFIFIFLTVLVSWMLLNTGVLARWQLQFDPYPYIFLNLMLSMVAALQAPVIMMSQNRSAAKDRLAASHDYEVNLRAELEIHRLHKRIDEMHKEVSTLVGLLGKNGRT